MSDREALSDALSDAVAHVDNMDGIQITEVEPRQPPSALTWAVLVLLSAVGSWALFGPSKVAQGPQALAVTPVMDETSVRMDMWVQAMRVRAFEEENGRLPESAVLAGDPVEGVTYELVGRGVFRLTGAGQEFRHTWESTQTQDELLGDAMDRVRAGVVDGS